MYIFKDYSIIIFMNTVKEKNSTDFSKNLKRLRKNRGLSQFDLADLTGISQRMIGHYETHAVEPPLYKIEKLAKALNVKPSALFNEFTPNTDEIEISQFDTRSLKKLQDILSLPSNDRSLIYRMLNKLLRENQAKK